MKGKRKLAHDQYPLQLASGYPTRIPPARLAEGHSDLGREGKAGCPRQQHRDPDPHDERERKNGTVHPDLFAPDREAVGVGYQKVQTDDGQDQPQPCTGEREDEVLSEELAADAPFAGAQRSPYGQFALAPDQPRQGQVRYVSARQEKNHEHRSHHDQERGTCGLGEYLLPRASGDLVAEHFWIRLAKFILESPVDLAQLGLGHLDGGACCESPEYIGHAMGSGIPHGRAHIMIVRRVVGEDVRLPSSRVVAPRLEHTHDLHTLRRQLDGLAHDFGIGPEHAGPVVVREDHHGVAHPHRRRL